MDNKKKGIGIFIAGILVISIFGAFSVTASAEQDQASAIPERRGGAL